VSAYNWHGGQARAAAIVPEPGKLFEVLLQGPLPEEPNFIP
jgi:hypothetical protein